MIFHTGPTKPALVLLCCLGTWLVICSLSFGAPTPENVKLILELLKFESKELYENYSKSQASGMSADASLQLPCFSLGREAVTNISVIKAHLEKARVLSENTIDTTRVTRWLDSISCSNPLNLNISRPEDTAKSYARRVFVLTVLKQFSACMAELQAKDSIC
ncbi:interleukin-31 [Apodemus sylvaticus]|uniref:interleukin-31 n=1 Tax=Apodemus sylvaticus TaxID=10129 RepID=UPI0022440C1D|nr:interleukin-31 [Apodemus sylvaticus]